MKMRRLCKVYILTEVLGCFENYVKIRLFNPSMKNLVTISNWTQLFDSLQQRINKTQQYSLTRFCPLYYIDSYSHYPIIKFHQLFACNTKPDIDYPKMDGKVCRLFDSSFSCLKNSILDC